MGVKAKFGEDTFAKETTFLKRRTHFSFYSSEPPDGGGMELERGRVSAGLLSDRVS